jgi:hypothetical protein
VGFALDRFSPSARLENIPCITSDERTIIAYLLAHNEKTFKAESDGGNAATILAHGIVIILAQSNQHIDMQNVSMTIPDPIWDVLQFHKDQFTYLRRARLSRMPFGMLRESAPHKSNW